MNEQGVKPARRGRGASSASREGKSKGKKAEHPLAPLSGIFKDDPLWDEFVDALRRARAEEDTKDDVPG
jgi:hypothetical protein